MSYSIQYVPVQVVRVPSVRIETIHTEMRWICSFYVYLAKWAIEYNNSASAAELPAATEILHYLGILICHAYCFPHMIPLEQIEQNAFVYAQYWQSTIGATRPLTMSRMKQIYGSDGIYPFKISSRSKTQLIQDAKDYGHGHGDTSGFLPFYIFTLSALRQEEEKVPLAFAYMLSVLS